MRRRASHGEYKVIMQVRTKPEGETALEGVYMWHHACGTASPCTRTTTARTPKVPPLPHTTRLCSLAPPESEREREGGDGALFCSSAHAVSLPLGGEEGRAEGEVPADLLPAMDLVACSTTQRVAERATLVGAAEEAT